MECAGIKQRSTISPSPLRFRTARDQIVLIPCLGQPRKVIYLSRMTASESVLHREQGGLRQAEPLQRNVEVMDYRGGTSLAQGTQFASYKWVFIYSLNRSCVHRSYLVYAICRQYTLSQPCVA